MTIANALAGSQQLAAQQNALLASARETVPFAQEFEKLFGGAFTQISNGRFGWSYNGMVGLYGRYDVRALIPITIDTNRLIVTGFGSPEIHIWEIEHITPVSGGGASVKYNPTNRLLLKSEDWKKVVAARGDFSVIGFPLKTNAALSNWTAYCPNGGYIIR